MDVGISDGFPAYGGRRINNKRGKMCIKTRFTHGAILWVAGDRKWTLSTITETHIDNVTRIIVNSKYFPNKGTTNDVDGIISARSKKNTVSDTRMLTERAT